VVGASAGHLAGATEMDRTQLVPFGMQHSTFGACMAATHRTLVAVMADKTGAQAPSGGLEHSPSSRAPAGSACSFACAGSACSFALAPPPPLGHANCMQSLLWSLSLQSPGSICAECCLLGGGGPHALGSPKCCCTIGVLMLPEPRPNIGVLMLPAHVHARLFHASTVMPTIAARETCREPVNSSWAPSVLHAPRARGSDPDRQTDRGRASERQSPLT
jgi:hypothetical protein